MRQPKGEFRIGFVLVAKLNQSFDAYVISLFLGKSLTERDKIVSSSPTLQSSSSSERSDNFSFTLGVVIEFTGFMMNHSSSSLSFSMLTLLSIKASSSALIS